MGGFSNAIQQLVPQNQQQTQAPQYGQQAPMAGNGVISQAYNQAINQQPQQNIMGNGGFNQPSYANSGTPSYSIGGQQFGGPNSSMQQPMGSIVQPSMGRMGGVMGGMQQQPMGDIVQAGMGVFSNMPTQQEGLTSASPEMERARSLVAMNGSMGGMGSMYDRPMAGVPSRGFGPMSPTQQMMTQNNVPMSGMPQQGMFGQPNQFQGGQNSMQRMMQNYQNSGREIPQGMQRYFDNMSSRQNQGSQAKPQVTNQPQMNEQHRLAKALRGD